MRSPHARKGATAELIEWGKDDVGSAGYGWAAVSEPLLDVFPSPAQDVTDPQGLGHLACIHLAVDMPCRALEELGEILLPRKGSQTRDCVRVR